MNDLHYFLVGGINKHFLGFSKDDLIQMWNAIGNKCNKTKEEGFVIMTARKYKHIEILFVLQAVLSIVNDFHSLNGCFWSQFRQKC